MKIPIAKGLPIIGQNLDYFRDAQLVRMENYHKYGKIYFTNFFGDRILNVIGPEATRIVLQDKDKIFSSQLGWQNVFGKLFDRSFAMSDFDEHRRLRLFFAPFFNSSSSSNMDTKIDSILRKEIAKIEVLQLNAYKYVRELNLRIAIGYVLDIQDQQLFQQLYKYYEDIAYGSVSFIRTPIFGTKYRNAIQGKVKLDKLILEIIEKKLYGAESMIYNIMSSGNGVMTNFEVAQHISFILLAAHDTASVVLVNSIYELVRDHSWQDELRIEAAEFIHTQDPLSRAFLKSMKKHDLFVKEILRIYPPLARILRTNIKEVEVYGYKIPAGTRICINPRVNHMLPEYWEKPEQFNPYRFYNNEIQEVIKPDPALWIPYGLGPHMCLGMQIADIQIKGFLIHLLSKFSLTTNENLKTIKFKQIPFIKPATGLDIQLISYP